MTDQELLALFRSVAPEFKAKTDEEILNLLENTKVYISEKRFGKRYGHALVFLAAHTLKLSDISAAEGSDSTAFAGIKSEREGDLERTYGDSNANDESMLMLTYYGKTFKAIRKTCIVSAITRLC